MSYHITVTGKKDDVIAEMRAKADEAKRNGLSSVESKALDEEIESVTKQIEEHSTEGDGVSVTLQGSQSQDSTGYATSRAHGLSIARGIFAGATPMNVPGPTTPGVGSRAPLAPTDPIGTTKPIV